MQTQESEPDEAIVAAIARWLEQGITSRTHPVLGFACRRFLEPAGIEVDALEAEPFSALESGLGGSRLIKAVWNPTRVDSRTPENEPLVVLGRSPEQFRVSIDSAGGASVRKAAPDASWKELEDGWAPARRLIQAAQDADRFVHAAAAIILSGRCAAAYAGGDDEALCRMALEWVRESAEGGPSETRSSEAEGAAPAGAR